MVRVKIMHYDQSINVLLPLTSKEQHKEWFYKLDIQIRQTSGVRKFTLAVTQSSCL